jgi:hypothetical protein
MKIQNNFLMSFFVISHISKSSLSIWLTNENKKIKNKNKNYLHLNLINFVAQIEYYKFKNVSSIISFKI